MNTSWILRPSAGSPRCSSLRHYSDLLSETDNWKLLIGIIHVLCSSFFFWLLPAPLEDLRRQKRKKRKHMIFPPSLLATLLKDIAVWETNGRNNEYWIILCFKLSVLFHFLYDLLLSANEPFSVHEGQGLLFWVMYSKVCSHLFSPLVGLLNSLSTQCYPTFIFAETF